MPYPALSGPRDARCLAHSRTCATLHAVCRRRRTVSEAPGKKTEEARECIEEPALAAARSNPLPHLLYPGGPYPLPFDRRSGAEFGRARLGWGERGGLCRDGRKGQ